MLNNFRNLLSIYQSLGTRWVVFRMVYALRRRAGFLRRQMPAYEWKDRPLATWLKKDIPSRPEAYIQWRRQNSPAFFFKPFRAPKKHWDHNERRVEVWSNDIPWNPQLCVEEAERVLRGELKYFAHSWIRTEFPPDWHRDPFSGIKLDANKHWLAISDDQDVDIKFIWEASRFSMVYPLVRAYASTRDERFAEAFWELIQSWAESNSPNTGPNWMDGQEAALRLLSWTFGFYAFMDSPSTTPERIAQFTVMVAAHAERIYKNISYAISTQSNHTISEGFGIWLVGLLFPELKDADKYFAFGKQLLEQEAAAQVFPDGSYSMYSLNYHRFILQIYFCMIRLGELNQSPAPSLIHQRITASIDFLSQLIDPATGQMPVYGSNDGALVLPLNNCDFTDYRPLLQLGSYLTKKELFFKPGPWDEDLFWFFGPQALQSNVHPPVQASQNYPDGGISILHDIQSKTMIRCTDFRSRPSHADQLHVDLWQGGINIACDAGTYLYSGKGVWRNGLAHTPVHNTVSVDHQDQMKMVSRFTWTDWTKGKILQHREQVWQGEQDGYRRLADPVTHKRTVISLGDDRWLVVDHLNGKQAHNYALHWLLNDFPWKQQDNGILLSVDSMKYKVQVGLVAGDFLFSVVRADENSTRGWRSRYYGEKEPAISLMLETNSHHAIFWTFFGFADDTVEMMGNSLSISSGDEREQIDLGKLNK